MFCVVGGQSRLPQVTKLNKDQFCWRTLDEFDKNNQKNKNKGILGKWQVPKFVSYFQLNSAIRKYWPRQLPIVTLEHSQNLYYETSTMRLCAAAAYGMDVPSTKWQFREQSNNDARQQQSNNYAHSLTPNCQKIQKYLHWKADQFGPPGPLGVKGLRRFLREACIKKWNSSISYLLIKGV
jgi:hypothetical protein